HLAVADAAVGHLDRGLLLEAERALVEVQRGRGVLHRQVRRQPGELRRANRYGGHFFSSLLGQSEGGKYLDRERMSRLVGAAKNRLHRADSPDIPDRCLLPDPLFASVRTSAAPSPTSSSWTTAGGCGPTSSPPPRPITSAPSSRASTAS